jgi:hypothetical protein
MQHPEIAWSLQHLSDFLPATAYNGVRGLAEANLTKFGELGATLL